MNVSFAEPSAAICPQSSNMEFLGRVCGCVQVKGSLDSILELINHYFFDDSVNSLRSVLKICFAGKPSPKVVAQLLIYEARSKKAA
jgi:hypothetical protein